MNNFYLFAERNRGPALVNRLGGGDQQQQQQICIRFLFIFYVRK